jgi:hypothetical protein
MSRRVVEFDMQCSKEPSKYLTRNNNGFPKWDKGFFPTYYKKSIFGNGYNIEVTFNVLYVGDLL